jgi:hypothetical protein
MLKLNINTSLAEEHYKSVKDSIQDRIKAIIKNNYIEKDNKKYVLNNRLKSQISIYLNDANLKELITCLPSEIEQKVNDFKIKKKAYLDPKGILYKLWYRIFYDYGYEKIEKSQFIQNINCETCPYCNRSYTYCLDDEGKIKPEIDHFYPKSIYPLLAASYFNLIPSCQTCNGYGGKHNTDTYITKITNPYLLTPQTFTFKYSLISLSRTNPISGNLNIEVEFENYLKPHLDVFKLDKLYEKHKDHVAELIMKAKFKYNAKYRAYLKSYRYLKLNDAEIDRLIIGNYTKHEELHKRPLSKLYLDVSKKLGLV